MTGLDCLVRILGDDVLELYFVLGLHVDAAPFAAHTSEPGKSSAAVATPNVQPQLVQEPFCAAYLKEPDI